MISKLTRVRLLALLCGPLLGIAAGLIYSLSMGLTLRLMPNTDAQIWEPISMAMAWIPITLLVAALAAILGSYDLLVIVTCVVPAMLYFAANYAASISSYLPDNGHTLYDIVGGIPPFDYPDQLSSLFHALGWALSAAAAGIALKRWLLHLRGNPSSSILTSGEKPHLWRLVAFDLGFLFLVTFVVLAVDLGHQLRLGQPDAIIANATNVLDSPASTPADREGALSDLQEFSEKFKSEDVARAVVTLRREVGQQPPPVNLVVAKVLITFQDYSAVPLIEAALQRAAQPGAIAPPGGWGDLANSMGSIKDPAVLPFLIQLFDSPNADIRYGALQGIRNFRTPDAIAPLVKGLDDPDPRIKNSSEWGLGLLLGGDERFYGWHPPHYDSAADEHQVYLDSLKAWVKDWEGKSSGP